MVGLAVEAVVARKLALVRRITCGRRSANTEQEYTKRPWRVVQVSKEMRRMYKVRLRDSASDGH